VPTNKKTLFILLLVFLTASILPAFGSREKAAKQKPQIVQVTGVVRLTGSEPLTELVISNSQDEWYIIREEANKLRNLQHRTITVEAEETITELRFANGHPAGHRRELKKVKLLKIH